MIPLSDQGRRVHRFPVITIILIAINAVVFLYQISLNERSLENFVLAYGVTPFEITTGRDVPPAIPWPVWATFFTSMFMHGGWMHIIGNMLYLWVFGDNIEDALGSVFYPVFYLVSGVAAAGAQIIADTTSRVPSIGASGAVAGVLGAYLLLYPTHRVNTLIFLGYFIRIVQLPAILVLGFWIVLQVFSGVTSSAEQSNVAYWAHVGGFAAGMVLVLPMRILRRGEAGRAGHDNEWG